MASTGGVWGSRAASWAWGPILLFAVLYLWTGVSAVLGRDGDWVWAAVQGFVLGVLALGIALDLRRRGQGTRG